MQKTSIEWVTNPDGTQGYSWNPIKGLCKGGCSYCYGKKIYKRFKLDPRIRFDHEDYFKPFEHKIPAGIFVCSTHDLFGDWIKPWWQREILRIIINCPQHRFYILTKYPENIPWNEMPNNVWLGVTITGKESDEKQLRLLEDLTRIPATLHFVSFEPLLGPIAFEVLDVIGPFDEIEWAIAGAQTQPTKLPEIDWINDIIDVTWWNEGPALFLKKNLKKLAPAISKYQGFKLGCGLVQQFSKEE